MRVWSDDYFMLQKGPFVNFRFDDDFMLGKGFCSLKLGVLGVYEKFLLRRALFQRVSGSVHLYTWRLLLLRITVTTYFRCFLVFRSYFPNFLADSKIFPLHLQPWLITIFKETYVWEASLNRKWTVIVVILMLETQFISAPWWMKSFGVCLFQLSWGMRVSGLGLFDMYLCFVYVYHVKLCTCVM